VRGEQDATVLSNFLLQFYESAQYIPKLVVVPALPEDAATLEELLSEKRQAKVEIRVPERGEKRRLKDLADENAREALAVMKVKWLADATRTERALDQLREELSLPGVPRRIECFDNSNIQGTSAVSSMVVFVDGKPAPGQYRKFRVKTVTGADDFATMAEIMRRRFRHAAPGDAAVEVAERTGPGDRWDLPDLVIIDGGKGQLNAAVEAMRELGVYEIPVVGLAKQHEEIFVPGEDEPIVLPRGSEALYLVQRVRDEAHRFAITYHRKVRAKSSIQSALDTIPGIGPRRKAALLRKFGSLRAIREASVDEIASTVGFTRALAERVKDGV
jgi:excinuclease ABC subunit C